MSAGIIVLIVFLCLVAIAVTLLFVFVPMKSWWIALTSGAHISMAKLANLKMRKTPVQEIVSVYCMAKKANINISINDLETHFLAGGNIRRIVEALITSKSAKYNLSLELLKAIDLSGRNVVEVVKSLITPKIVETDWVSAIARDGIELNVKASITLKTNIQKILGGAGEDTIIARVSECIVSCVGSSERSARIMEKPEIISDFIMKKRIDVESAFEVVSVDIIEINIGNNIGAKLIKDEADKKRIMAQAHAEERRAMAFALEQEMKAKTQEMKSVVLAAEAEIPKAIAQAIKEGKFNIMDYYKLQNIQADTAMRKTIAGETDDNEPKDE